MVQEDVKAMLTQDFGVRVPSADELETAMHLEIIEPHCVGYPVLSTAYSLRPTAYGLRPTAYGVRSTVLGTVPCCIFDKETNGCNALAADCHTPVGQVCG